MDELSRLSSSNNVARAPANGTEKWHAWKLWSSKVYNKLEEHKQSGYLRLSELSLVRLFLHKLKIWDINQQFHRPDDEDYQKVRVYVCRVLKRRVTTDASDGKTKSIIKVEEVKCEKTATSDPSHWILEFHKDLAHVIAGFVQPNDYLIVWGGDVIIPDYENQVMFFNKHDESPPSRVIIYSHDNTDGPRCTDNGRFENPILLDNVNNFYLSGSKGAEYFFVQDIQPVEKRKEEWTMIPSNDDSAEKENSDSSESDPKRPLTEESRAPVPSTSRVTRLAAAEFDFANAGKSTNGHRNRKISEESNQSEIEVKVTKKVKTESDSMETFFEEESEPEVVDLAESDDETRKEQLQKQIPQSQPQLPPPVAASKDIDNILNEIRNIHGELNTSSPQKENIPEIEEFHLALEYQDQGEPSAIIQTQNFAIPSPHASTPKTFESFDFPEFCVEPEVTPPDTQKPLSQKTEYSMTKRLDKYDKTHPVESNSQDLSPEQNSQRLPKLSTILENEDVASTSGPERQEENQRTPRSVKRKLVFPPTSSRYKRDRPVKSNNSSLSESIGIRTATKRMTRSRNNSEIKNGKPRSTVTTLTRKRIRKQSEFEEETSQKLDRKVALQLTPITGVKVGKTVSIKKFDAVSKSRKQ